MAQGFPQTQVGVNHKGHMGADGDEKKLWMEFCLNVNVQEPRVIRSPVICDLGHLRLTVRHEQRTLGHANHSSGVKGGSQVIIWPVALSLPLLLLSKIYPAE